MSITITEEQFKIYEEIRESWTTNMFDISKVKKTMLDEYDLLMTPKEIFTIMKNYDKLKEMFRIERNKRLEELNHGPLDI